MSPTTRYYLKNARASWIALAGALVAIFAFGTTPSNVPLGIGAVCVAAVATIVVHVLVDRRNVRELRRRD
jgi:ABC-type Fe3+-siderophore transport system permease subunit